MNANLLRVRDVRLVSPKRSHPKWETRTNAIQIDGSGCNDDDEGVPEHAPHDASPAGIDGVAEVP
jgi:hypothetical protein